MASENTIENTQGSAWKADAWKKPPHVSGSVIDVTILLSEKAAFNGWKQMLLTRNNVNAASTRLLLREFSRLGSFLPELPGPNRTVFNRNSWRDTARPLCLSYPASLQCHSDPPRAIPDQDTNNCETWLQLSCILVFLNEECNVTTDRCHNK